METTADTESAGGYIKEGKMRILRFLVLVIAVFLLASAWAAPLSSGAVPNGPQRLVKIEFDKTSPQKSLVCTPHKFVTRKSFPETITWVCPGYKIFTIDFGWNSPFPEMSYSTIDGRISQAIGKEFPEGRFPYFIAVLDGDNQIITIDPDLIIRK
jgi:hypothetical protein